MDQERRWRVLVADDDPAICMLIETVLRRGPYEIRACADGESAVQTFEREGPFDMLICDFMLPGISGLDVIERVRAREDGTLPILMISGHTTHAVDRARHAGADLFLNKPFTLSQLRGAVAALLAPRSPAT
ncbi:MAG: response regulator [Candidatus Tyrphobacter sp.]